MIYRPKQRDRVDAGWRLQIALGCQWPGAGESER
jgi:hypothetical protein